MSTNSTHSAPAPPSPPLPAPSPSTASAGWQSWASPPSTACPTPSNLAREPAPQLQRPRHHRRPRRQPGPLAARQAPGQAELPFKPARVVLQDFTGVPAVVDLAAMRSAMQPPGRRSAPHQPADSRRPGHRPFRAGRSASARPMPCRSTSTSNSSATASATSSSAGARRPFDNFRVVPPAVGIVHQVNLEYLAKCVVPAQTATAWSPSPTPSSAPTATPP